ncbi:MAG TPA: hypothetical protein VHF25_10340 [Nitriliruptorales bacterium]|nr:hypothetical protein [Nitriliruptorales bacterium]
MGDDEHRVTFGEFASDRLCWGSGATGHGCGREATTQVGLCDRCHAEISRRVEDGRAGQPSALGGGHIIELNVEFGGDGQVVSTVALGDAH